MPIGQHQRSFLPLLRVPVYVCLSMLFAFLLFPLNASASGSVSSANKPTFQVKAGFNSRYRDSNWIPVQVSLRNDGADFTGFISVNVPAPSVSITRSSPTLTYQQAITLPTSAQKQVTLNVPISFGDQGSTQSITVNLLDTNNQKISSENTAIRSIGPSDIFVGILSDQTTGFAPLNTVPLADPTASILVEPLNAPSMPTMTEVLKNFDLLILDNFTTSSLSKNQLTALQNWVNWGGSLIVIGGPAWRRTLSPLPADLLPVALTGTQTLPIKTSLLPIGGPTKGGPVQHLTSDTMQGAVIASTAIPSSQSTVALASTTIPLLVQKKLGLGLICYLAFDPTLNPVLTWSRIGALWQGLLLRTLGDQLLATGPTIAQSGGSVLTSDTSSGGFRDLLQSSLPNMLPPTWLILALLLGYVAVLGPVRLLLVRFLKQRDWSWRITLSAIVIFSALSYTLALQQKGTSIVSSSISILQLGQPDAHGTPTHATTYVGVYLPSQGNFQVHIPGSNLVQTYTEASSAQSLPATILSSENATTVKLQGTNTWGLRTLVTKQDSHVSGSIIPHLTFYSNNLVRGTVTNSLPYALNNAYLLISNHFQALGNMAIGETRTISLTVENPPNATNDGVETSLADQIATSNNLQVPFVTYYNNTQRLSALQRHMAQIAILSGETYQYCVTAPCFQSTQPFTTSNGVLVNSSSTLVSSSGPSTQATGRDPLLIPGAQATLIGWIAPTPHTTTSIDVAGSHIAGTQETFLQAPLTVNFSDPVNQTVIVPSDIITGQLIDAQGQSAQTQSPGIYTLNAGSMTFEFTLPAGLQLHNSNITLTESPTLTQGGIPLGPGTTTSIINANQMHIFLYNWQKRVWERFAFNQFSLSINNAQAYIDSNGRIMVQFANQGASQGTAVFNKPSLQMRGLLAN